MEQYSLVYDDGYNTVGNLTDVTEYSTDTMEYEYDALYRLTSETRTGTGSYSHDYEYDLAGNLTTLDSSSFATYDDANKFSSLSIGTYEYDSDGNMRRFAGTGLPTTYNTWDVRGKIISTVISGTTIAWEYDHRGLRVSRRGGIPNRYYIFAGSTLIGEIHGTTPAYAYTWGPDGIVSQRDIANTESYWYQFGPQGETRALVDDSASTVETYAFDAYGITLSGAPTLYNPFKYGGKFGYYSEDTAFGRILAGQRWYSPEHRRWISRDPIQYAGGDNLYAYVMGDPVNLVDPDGLAAENNSDHVVYVKPELTRTPVPLAPNGGKYDGDIDGITNTNSGNDWYKVPTGTDVVCDADGTPRETSWPGNAIPDFPDLGWITDKAPGQKGPGFPGRTGWPEPPQNIPGMHGPGY